MRKIINEPDQVVKESLAGLAASVPNLLRYDVANQILVRVDSPVKGKVALISGGGSGHEPLHGGFVGVGMLDAACPGEVFTSPVPDQMLAATKAVNGGAGVIHIVKNYTGDVLNFKMAADEASEEGIKVDTIVIDDDVAVQDSLYTAGRRGVGATVLAEKIAGAAAERGDALEAVADVVRHVNARARSFGIALSSCIPPASGKPIFDLPEGEMEVGIGIHGEPGRRRAPLGSAAEIADIMVEAVTSDLAAKAGSNVLAFVNGMGGTPLLELYLLYGEVEKRLRAAGLTPVRNLVGSYITSLEMAGASLTVLELDENLTALWDAPVHTAALRWGG
ncbi:MAG: dihydroxyacetone kinase subunit DhaK [Candidatus Dormiibacterota bacterium]|jgi:dihydroxyacetone kinase-like protein